MFTLIKQYLPCFKQENQIIQAQTIEPYNQLEYDSDLDSDLDSLAPSAPPSEASLESDSDSDIESDLSGGEGYYKMQSILDHVENDSLEELTLYIRANFPQIKVNAKSTQASLTDALLKDLYTNMSQKQIKDTMERIRTLINTQTENLNFKSKRFQKIRSILKERFGEDHKLYKLHRRKGGITFEQHSDKQQTATMNRDNRLSNRVQVAEKDAYEILNKLSIQDDVYSKIAVMSLAVGCRFIEAARISSFKKVPSRPDYPEGGTPWVLVTGIAKKKKGDPQDYDVERPVFGMSVDELIDLQKDTRKELKKMYTKIDELDNEGVNKLLLNNVNRRIAELGIPDVKTSHMLRKIYANISYKLLDAETKSKMDPHRWVQIVLTHKTIETTASYMNVKVSKTKFKMKNQDDIEKKIDTIDEKDHEQDVEIDNLKERVQQAREKVISSITKKLGPKVTDDGSDEPVYGVPPSGYIVQVPHDGGTVQIKAPMISRGNAEERCKIIMKQLNEAGIVITEKLLKEYFQIGSNTISKVKVYKGLLNAKINKK